MNELVSVIIPSYNHEKYIEECIRSVLNQTYKNLEIIIQDDCSQDDTPKIIKGIKDKRLKKIFMNKNQGVVKTMNELMKACHGDYIAIIGSDDVWHPSKIEKQMEVMKKNPSLGAVFTNVDIIDENGEKVDHESMSNIFKKDKMTQAERIRCFYETGNHLCHSSSLITRIAYNEIGLYNKAYRQLHDYDYWTRLVSKFEIYVIDEPLMSYRREFNGKNSVSSSSNTNLIRTINEQYNINSNMIMNLSDELFLEAFKDLLKVKDSKDKEEILCEKYFILLNMKICNINDRRKAYDIIFDNSSILDILEKKYNYKLNDFYKDTGEINEGVPIDLLPQYKDLLNDFDIKIREYEARLKEYERKAHIYDRITNVRLWKTTRIIKRIFNIFRRKKDE